MTTRTRKAGFTLLEMLAVVLLTSIVIGVALNHYVNLSRAGRRATEHTRGIRRATALLDRLSRDFESVVLVVKEPETDPLDHPWLFLGESHHSDLGADHLKFVTRGNRPRHGAAHESDLQVVAYTLRNGEEGDFELMRWSSPRLPESLDRELPGDESDGAVLVADGLAAFGVQFIDKLGRRNSSWDSSQLVESGELPVAVDIEVAMVDPDDDLEREPEIYRRRVILPVRPLDMQELLDPNSVSSGGSGRTAEEEDGDEQSGESRPCEQTPCAGMMACQAIRCQAKLGQYPHSTEVLLNDLIQNPQPFCRWRNNTLRQSALRLLIDNPACR